MSFVAIARLVAAMTLAAVPLAGPAGAGPTSAASPLMVQTVAPIYPVLGADGETHLVYELLLINQSGLIVTVDSIGVVDAESGALIQEVSGDVLAGILRISLFGEASTTLEPSQSAIVFLHAPLAAGAELPKSLRHRISVNQQQPAKEVTAELGGLAIKPDATVAETVVFVSGMALVDHVLAVELLPPVRGANWVLFRGCCELASSHRGSTSIHDGELFVPERFAVDFVRIGDGDFLITGPGNELASYPQYGEPVYAVADGSVAFARNDQPEQTPGALPEGMPAELAGGNAVLLDIGDGRFAFYAHMQPGSVRVEAGDTVKAGDELGLIGNSGKSIGPHLHFHLIDRASPVAGDGLPFVFEVFTGQGAVGPDALALAFQGLPVPIDAAILAGPHAHVLPLGNQVVDFGE